MSEYEGYAPAWAWGEGEAPTVSDADWQWADIPQEPYGGGQLDPYGGGQFDPYSEPADPYESEYLPIEATDIGWLENEYTPTYEG